MKESAIEPAPQHIVTLEVASADAEPLAERFREAWEVEPVCLERPGSQRAWLECYFEEPMRARLAAEAARACEGVRAVAMRKARPEDWVRSVREHFRGRAFGRRLYIRPSWEEPSTAAAEREVVVLDPGLSFGTGNHFTTAFCLERLDELIGSPPPSSFLDLGTGSGVLAIAAARLGVPRVVGIEHDELALRYARAHVRDNGVEASVTLLEQDLLETPVREPFDLVCANLYTQLLLEIAPWLSRLAQHDLVLTGIEEVQVDAVADTYMQWGLTEMMRDGDGEWAGLHLRSG